MTHSIQTDSRQRKHSSFSSSDKDTDLVIQTVRMDLVVTTNLVVNLELIANTSIVVPSVYVVAI